MTLLSYNPIINLSVSILCCKSDFSKDHEVRQRLFWVLRFGKVGAVRVNCSKMPLEANLKWEGEKTLALF